MWAFLTHLQQLGNYADSGNVDKTAGSEWQDYRLCLCTGQESAPKKALQQPDA